MNEIKLFVIFLVVAILSYLIVKLIQSKEVFINYSLPKRGLLALMATILGSCYIVSFTFIMVGIAIVFMMLFFSLANFLSSETFINWWINITKLHSEDLVVIINAFNNAINYTYLFIFILGLLIFKKPKISKLKSFLTLLVSGYYGFKILEYLKKYIPSISNMLSDIIKLLIYKPKIIFSKTRKSVIFIFQKLYILLGLAFVLIMVFIFIIEITTNFMLNNNRIEHLKEINAVYSISISFCILIASVIFLYSAVCSNLNNNNSNKLIK